MADVIRRALAPLFRLRSLGLVAERFFWWRWIRTRGLEWPAEYAQRLDSARPLASHLVPFVEGLPSPVRVLDVGAGPVTAIGYRLDGKSLEITAVDVLAPQYDQMLRKHGIDPPIRTRYAEGERLSEQFADDSFDLVYAQNSLDHMRDPMETIRQMVRIAKPGAHVVLVHAVDEAESQRYIGLHQWNLSEREGRFVIWRPGQTIVVSSELGPGCGVSTKRDGETLHVDIQKLAPR